LQEKDCIIIARHIKGHQDNDKDRTMTTEEALNVEADELTHRARRLQDVKEYHKFPTNKVNFKINNKYINSHYPKMVNLAFHSIALREYYATKYGWTTQTIESLWWPVYFQSLTELSDPDRLRIQKFVNNRWPMLYREQKYYERATTTGYCRQCHLYNEKEDHIIRCRTPARQKIMDVWRKEVTTYLSEQHTPNTIRDAICHGFYTWLESGRNTPGIPSLPHRQTEVMKAYNNQETIGWQHYVRGRMTIEWGNLINKHLAMQKKYKFNAEQWGMKLMSINWKYILQLWETRNKEVNGDTPSKVESIRRQNMINEILHIQATHPDLPIAISHLISREPASLQAMTTSSISAYLYGAQLVAEAAKQHGKNIEQQTITQMYEQIRQRHMAANQREASIDTTDTN
jgi:hypothetical protein